LMAKVRVKPLDKRPRAPAQIVSDFIHAQ